MGQYRLCVMFRMFVGIGFMGGDGERAISIWLPFIWVYIGLEKYAKGVRIFERDF